MLADGAFVHLSRGVSLEQPIHLLYVTTDEAEAMLMQPRNLIVAEPNSQATVIEHYVANGEAAYWTNTLTEVIAEANANVTHYRLQEEGLRAFHVGGLHVHLDRDSRFTSHGIDYGGRLVRNELRSVLDAEGAECRLNGLTVAGGRQALLIHLLSPAQRPVQVTQDLAGFWERGYHQVKKELKGRYPKHYWPDDSLKAQATARVKPRKG